MSSLFEFFSFDINTKRIYYEINRRGYYEVF
nr:MAG TPA: hypothetical protein [Caudoviricetes sp.]